MSHDSFEPIGAAAARVVRRVDILRPKTDEEWLAFRKRDVTASVAGALLGVHDFTTAYQLWASKTGRIDDPEETPAMRRGRLLEPVVVEMLREERPGWLISYPLDRGYWRDGAARIGCTPDAFATAPDRPGRGIVQLKTTSEWAFRKKWTDPDTREVVLPLWIAIQAVIEAELTGADWASVALLVVGSGIDLYAIDIPLEEGRRVLSRLETAIAEFWRVVDQGGHPPIDWVKDGRAVLDVHRDSDGSAADLSDVAGFDALVQRYVEAKDAAREAADIADRIRPQLIEILGNHDTAETLAWRVTAKTRIRKEYVVKAGSSRPLVVTRKESPQ